MTNMKTTLKPCLVRALGAFVVGQWRVDVPSRLLNFVVCGLRMPASHSNVLYTMSYVLIFVGLHVKKAPYGVYYSGRRFE